MKRKSGRVVLLFILLLVIILAVGAFFLLQGEGDGGGLFTVPPTPTPRAEPVVIPKELILAGSYITNTAGLFETGVSTRTEDIAPGMVRGLRQIDGKVALVDLPAGRPVRLEQFGEPGMAYRIAPGKRAFAIQVDLLAGVVGFIKPNDYVDVVISGRTELYLPQIFPLEREYISPEGRPEYNYRPFPWTNIEPFRLLTVKTAIEDIRVLEVISITTQPGQAGATPLPGLPLGWFMVLEVTQQQAEVLRFAVEEAWPFQLTLRPYNEPRTEYDPLTTSGISTWILLDPNGDYRLPIPRAIPHPITPGNLPSGLIP